MKDEVITNTLATMSGFVLEYVIDHSVDAQLVQQQLIKELGRQLTVAELERFKLLLELNLQLVKSALQQLGKINLSTYTT